MHRGESTPNQRWDGKQPYQSETESAHSFYIKKKRKTGGKMFFEQSCATKMKLVMSVVVDPDVAGVTRGFHS